MPIDVYLHCSNGIGKGLMPQVIRGKGLIWLSQLVIIELHLSGIVFCTGLYLECCDCNGKRTESLAMDSHGRL